MKTMKFLSAMMAMVLLMVGCTSDEPVANVSGGDTPSVRVTLGGSAAKVISRANTQAAENSEKTVGSLLAVLFNTQTGFYKTVEARPDGEAYTFIVEDDATYDLYLVANADANLRTALENIPAGTPADDPEAGLEAVVATQTSDMQGEFLMVSKYPQRVTTHITQTTTLPEVRMERLAARFDIENAADGIAVTKITLNNRAVKTSILSRNEMPGDADWFESSKDYTPNGMMGNKTNPTTYAQQIYSYENFSAKGSDKLTSITIEYTEDGDTKTHTVNLIDPDATDLTPLAIKRNHLYRIRLSKAFKLDFDLTVSDWTADEDINIADLPVDLPYILPEDEQEELNKRLLVYDLFTDYNVKSLDLETKTVTFYDNKYITQSEYSFDSYFNYNDLRDKGLILGDDIYVHDDAGNKYRIPKVAELQLLIPIRTDYVGYKSNAAEYNEKGLKILYHPILNVPSAVSTQSNTPFSETLIFVHNTNGGLDKAQNVTTESSAGFKGETILKVGHSTRSFYYEPHNTYRSYCSNYGLRFKGTSQYAAYRWELKSEDNWINRYLSIKIKALPEDSDITIDFITDNEKFWTDGYIEIIIPCIKSISSTNYDDEIYNNESNEGYIMGSTLWDSNAIYNLSFYETSCNVSISKRTDDFPLRLVKVKE